MKKVAYVVVACALTGMVGGCYSYLPVQTPQPGMDVRARLTTEAAVRRSQGLDDAIVRLDGTIVEATGSSVSLDVLVARTSSAFQNVVIRDTVKLEAAEIQSLLVRKFSPAQTAIVSVGLVAAAYGAVLSIDRLVGGTGDDDGGGDPTFTVPLLSWVGFRQLVAGARR
jgi:hypothetical protein